MTTLWDVFNTSQQDATEEADEEGHEYRWPAFQERTIKTESGGKVKARKICVPNRAMRILHRDLIDRLLEIDVDFYHASGVMGGANAYWNAKTHAYNRHFYRFDLRDAYPSLNLERLAICLHEFDASLGSEEDIVLLLEGFCAKDGVFATGAPASPLLFNMYCAKMIDPLMSEYVLPWQRYTRYLDDMVFSSPNGRVIQRRLRENMRQIVIDAGFDVNHDREKSVVIDRWSNPITITGVALTKCGQLEPSARFIEKVEDALGSRTLFPDDRERGRLAGLASFLFDFEENLASERTRDLQARVAQAMGAVPREGSRALKRSSYTREKEFEELLAHVRLSQVVGRFVHFGKSNTKTGVYWGRCPFHKEKTASLRVDDHRGRYKCFGCGASGDAVNFVRETESLTFGEAVSALAKRFGFRLTRPDE